VFQAARFPCGPDMLAPGITATHEGAGLPAAGSGVICATRAIQPAVIPAKAGIHSANLRKWTAYGLDSRFRGNDGGFVRDATPNDTTTWQHRLLDKVLQII